MDDPDFWSKVVPESERAAVAPERLGRRRSAQDAAESIKAQYSSDAAIETAMVIDDHWKVRCVTDRVPRPPTTEACTAQRSQPGRAPRVRGHSNSLHSRHAARPRTHRSRSATE